VCLAQVEKILQLHLACEQRIGVIIVGPSGSGKSTLWGVLEKVCRAALAVISAGNMAVICTMAVITALCPSVSPIVMTAGS
jgi:ABC-type nitrate/sulfonate/bicarbonate transport system ATPase subunit